MIVCTKLTVLFKDTADKERVLVRMKLLHENCMKAKKVYPQKFTNIPTTYACTTTSSNFRLFCSAAAPLRSGLGKVNIDKQQTAAAFNGV